MKNKIMFLVSLLCLLSFVYAKEVNVFYFTEGATSSSGNVDVSSDLVKTLDGLIETTYNDTDTIMKLNSIRGNVFTLYKLNDSLVPGKEWYMYDNNDKIHYYSQSDQYLISDLFKELGYENYKSEKTLELNFHANWKSAFAERTKVSKISFDEPSIDVHVGASKKVKPVIYPDTALGVPLSWSSSNTKVATVNDKGYVEGKKKGTATITVVSKNGKKGSFKVDVETVSKKTHYVYIHYNLDGGKLNSAHGSSITTKKDKIYCNDSLDCTAIPYGDKMIKAGLRNINHPNNVNLYKDGYYLVKSEAWKGTNGKTYSQSKVYKASDFCNASQDDCIATLTPNWKKSDKVYNIALIGNSKTYYGEKSFPKSRVAEVFRALSTFNEKSAKVEVIAKGGTTLLEKTKDKKYSEPMANGNYKYVVLQEQTKVARNKEGITDYKKGVDAVLALLKNKNANIYLRTSWPEYKIKEEGKEKANKIYNTHLENMNKNTDEIASMIGAKSIHDGNAFKEAIAEGIDIYLDDYNHPTPEGAYLAAACIYKNIYNEKAINIKYYYDLDEEVALKLLKIADDNC